MSKDFLRICIIFGVKPSGILRFYEISRIFSGISKIFVRFLRLGIFEDFLGFLVKVYEIFGVLPLTEIMLFGYCLPITNVHIFARCQENIQGSLCFHW